MSADGDGAGLVTESIAAISAIPGAEWDRLVAAASAPTPFVRHAFLDALERSGSVGPGTGWTPNHIVQRKGGEIVAAAPAYLKDHSFGEYVFDHGWADAYQRAGGRYYPKLLCAAPFTPVVGSRLFAAGDVARAHVAQTLKTVAAARGLSSVHVNFHDDDDALTGAGYLERHGLQYHWFNRGYESYEHFLGALSSRKRKALRRERRDAAAGLRFRRVTGADLREHHWDVFWNFYQDTGARKWGRPYLTRAFFSLLGERMADQVLLVFAEDGARPIAGALNLIGGEALYGRYWGRAEDRPFLHFEVCYHQAIDFAIERKLARVEAGAQGDHKLARGYEPVVTKSAHWIENKGFAGAVTRFLEAERRQAAAEKAAIEAGTPFRRSDGTPD